MARLLNGGTDRIHFGAFNQPSAGCVGLRFKTASATANQHLASHTLNTTRQGWIFLLNNVANKLLVQAYGSTGTPTVNLPGTITVNDGNWHHLCFNFNRANGGGNEVFVDGVSDGTANSNAAWGGAGIFPTLGDSFDAFWASPVADVADFAVWGAQLTAEEVAAFAKGFSPSLIKPQSLAMYSPLVRDVRDIKAPFIGGVTGTSVTDHPRVIGGMV